MARKRLSRRFAVCVVWQRQPKTNAMRTGLDQFQFAAVRGRCRDWWRAETVAAGLYRTDEGSNRRARATSGKPGPSSIISTIQPAAAGRAVSGTVRRRPRDCWRTGCPTREASARDRRRPSRQTGYPPSPEIPAVARRRWRLAHSAARSMRSRCATGVSPAPDRGYEHTDSPPAAPVPQQLGQLPAARIGGINQPGRSE